MERSVLIRKKGFNYYTDYTELYLHKAFEKKGFFLVKEEGKCSFSVMAAISDREKYMIFLSPYFDTLTEADMTDLAKTLSDHFKSEVFVVPHGGTQTQKNITHRFMFSDTYSAFEENPYIFDGQPELTRRTFSLCKSGVPYIADYVNYGGTFRGIEIKVSFNRNDVILQAATLTWWQGKDEITQELIFQKNDHIFTCRADDFVLEKGINKYSAVLRGKKKYDEETKCGFCIRFIPLCPVAVLLPDITVSPLHF